MTEANRDQNRVPTLLGTSNVDEATPVPILADPSTGELLVKISPGLQVPAHDYIAVTYPSTTTETYTFRDGGVSGTVVGVVTLTYTDTTKENLSSVERTT